MKGRLFIIGLLLLAAMPIEAAGVISKDRAVSHFVSGNLAYKEADYSKAVSEYEAIIKGGRESGAVYYNLGNSHFKMGEFGKAILNYERVRRLIPRALARASRPRRAEPAPRPPPRTVAHRSPPA